MFPFPPAEAYPDPRSLENIKNTFYKIQIYDSVLFFYTRY